MSAERSRTTTKGPEGQSFRLPKRIPIERVAKALQASAEASRTLIGEIQAKLDKDFMDPSYRQVLGGVFIGASHKLVVGGDGRVQEQDWTTADLMAAGDRLMDEQEAGTRNQ